MASDATDGARNRLCRRQLNHEVETVLFDLRGGLKRTMKFVDLHEKHINDLDDR